MIHFAKPMIGIEEAEAVSRTVLSGWVTQGPKTLEFEKEFSKVVTTSFSCAVTNGTAALIIGLKAVGVKPGDVVITVSHSFIATANAIRLCGAEPIFVDIDPSSFNIDPNQIEETLQENCEQREDGFYYKYVENISLGDSPLKYFYSLNNSNKIGKVSAILPVHQYGMPCDLKKILEISSRYNIPVVEDAACALRSEISFDRGKSWEKIGKPHGAVACFSFHPRKIITTGEGGMLTTIDSDIDRLFRLSRHHGMNISDHSRNKSNEIVIEEYLSTGNNYRLSDLHASMGLEQLKKLEKIYSMRRAIGSFYKRLLIDMSWIQVQKESDNCHTNYQTFPILLSQDLPFQRNELMQYLLEKGIATRRANINAHEELPYRFQKWSLPVSEALSDRGLALPLYPELKEEEATKCIDAIKEFHDKKSRN